MMDFNAFTEEIISKLKEVLPPPYREGEYLLQKIQKLNESYTGLIIRNDETDVCPAIKMELYYQDYKNGKSSDEIVRFIRHFIVSNTHVTSVQSLSEEMLSYEKIKPRLFIRISNRTINREILKKIPHKTELDLAITYHISMDPIKGQKASVLIHKELLKSWQISQEQLYRDALENSSKTMPCEILPICEVLEAHDAPRELIKAQQMPLYVVRSKGWGSGAALFYPGTVDKLMELARGDFYILPSSIHEVLMLPSLDIDCQEKLKEMVHEINNNLVDAKERLSDNVYYYDSQEKKLKII